MNTIRIGIVGLGKNTRLRHVPGFRECKNVEIAAVCNRSRESTQQAAQEFAIPIRFESWQELVQSPEIDAVMIGTWPYLHCPITLAALENGKHVLTEARMARSLDEANQMLTASKEHPDLVTQIVPSPFGFRAGQKVVQMLSDGYVGDVREVFIRGITSEFAAADSPLHWRQSAELSGMNMLTLGILHETAIRWLPDPVSVMASSKTFTKERASTETGAPSRVERPDSVHVLTELPNGAHCIYHLSAAVHHGTGFQICIYGSAGTLKYELAPQDQLFAARHDDVQLRPIDIEKDLQGKWQVESDFIDAIRNGVQPSLTDFATGVRYMRFTEAVEESCQRGCRIVI